MDYGIAIPSIVNKGDKPTLLANLPCCYYLSTPTIKAQQQR